MNKSETIKELAQALAQAQANMPAVQFNATNPFLKNKYADLGAIIAASKPVLATNGLSISQTMTCDDERIGVTTLLMHTSGEWLEDTATLPLGEERGKSLAQVAGSIVTYLRRYGWSAILGMYADEDGDGNGSQPAPRQKPAQKQPVKSNGNGHKPKEASATKPATPTKSGGITTKDGKPYEELTGEQLSTRFNSISKALKKDGLTEEQRAEYKAKQDRISEIFKERREAEEA